MKSVFLFAALFAVCGAVSANEEAVVTPEIASAVEAEVVTPAAETTPEVVAEVAAEVAEQGIQEAPLA